MCVGVCEWEETHFWNTNELLTLPKDKSHTFRQLLKKQ